MWDQRPGVLSSSLILSRLCRPNPIKAHGVGPKNHFRNLGEKVCADFTAQTHRQTVAQTQVSLYFSHCQIEKSRLRQGETLFKKAIAKGRGAGAEGSYRSSKTYDREIYKHLRGQPGKGSPFLGRSKQVQKEASVGQWIRGQLIPQEGPLWRLFNKGVSHDSDLSPMEREVSAQ